MGFADGDLMETGSERAADQGQDRYLMTDEGLAEFARKLAPVPFDKTTVSERRNAIEVQIKKKTSAVGMFESGSWTHGTAVSGHSDVDYMAFFSETSRPVKPSTALSN